MKLGGRVGKDNNEVGWWGGRNDLFLPPPLGPPTDQIIRTVWCHF